MSQRRELILGGPGCGKTTKLLDVVEQHLSAGRASQEIAYVAFTRKAASEAVERACLRFGLSDRDLPYFRTLHSFAFKELGLSRDQLMSTAHYTQLGDILKIKFGTVEDEFGHVSEQYERGSQYYYIEQQARLRCIPLKQMCLLDGRHSHYHVQHYQTTLNAYKKNHRVFDYTDLLEIWHNRMEELPVSVLIVDEAQDLSELQWRLVHKMSEGVEHVYYAGDDDQAIYQWAGADINHFLKLDAIKTVLPVSYRLPKQVFARCLKIASRIRHRYQKDWKPTERDGTVSIIGAPEVAPLHNGEWMILSRNHYHLENISHYLKAKGHVFTLSGKSSLGSADALAVRAWVRAQRTQDVQISDIKRFLSKFPKSSLKVNKGVFGPMLDEDTVSQKALNETYGINLAAPWYQSLTIQPEERAYIRSVQSKQPDLDRAPKIKISTIHAVKGGECDNVLLMPDMSSACYDSFVKQPDNESRVFYVGASRAKEQLVICQPQSPNFFPL